MSATATETQTLSETDAPRVVRFTIKPRRSVRWDATVVDNEHLHRKSSKGPTPSPSVLVCCIYRKPHNPLQDESSSDSSCSEDEDKNGYERQPHMHCHHHHRCPAAPDANPGGVSGIAQ
eukprot:m51a1_g1625 hypothetical protein (119) ;mRNA; f:252246-252872